MYQQGDVTVDDRFVRFGSKSFAVNKLTSVDVRQTSTRGSRSYIVLWLLAIVMLLVALGAQTFVPALFAAVFAYFGWQDWQRRHPTTTYQLFLVTAASEAQAWETTNQDAMLELRTAVEEAMARS